MLKLSVIIPVYNEAATLEEIITRVRATKLVDEIIVVDDGSSDDSPAILARLQNSGTPLSNFVIRWGDCYLNLNQVSFFLPIPVISS